MIFTNSEITEIDLGAVFFRIFKTPMVKIQFRSLRKMCFAKRTDFAETNFYYKFHKKTLYAIDDKLTFDPLSSRAKFLYYKWFIEILTPL